MKPVKTERPVPQDREVELKFLCAPEDLAAVLAAAPAGDDESRELISVYFDTAAHDLQKAGASLRVRESKGRRVQTLKRGEGLSREEYETPIEGLAPDPELGPLKSLLPRGKRLSPAFNVRVTRLQRTLRYAGAEIELALDQGEVTGGSGKSPICEVELELKSGAPQALFELARELSRAAPLYISFDGKAARGQALVAGAPLRARRDGKLRLPPAATVAQGFQVIARSAIGQIAANAVALRDAADPEAVHQLRIAMRRLRSSFVTFAPAVRDAGFAAVSTGLKGLGKITNAARDLDVFATDVLEPAKGVASPPSSLPALCAAVDAARLVARADVVDAVSSVGFRELLLEATAWVETGGWLTSEIANGPLNAFAGQALTARSDKLCKRGRHMAKADDTGRHHVRIEAKKLRYAVEGFRSLYPGKSTRRFLGQLKALQDALGRLNDLATVERLMAGLTLTQGAAFAAGELAGLRAAEKDQLIARAAKAFGRVANAAAPFA